MLTLLKGKLNHLASSTYQQLRSLIEFTASPLVLCSHCHYRLP